MKRSLLLLLTLASRGYCSNPVLELFDPAKAPSMIGNVAVKFVSGVGTAINVNGDVAGILNGTCGGTACDVAIYWENGNSTPVLASGTEFQGCTRPNAIDNLGNIYCEDLRVGFVTRSGGVTSLTPTQCEPNFVSARSVSVDDGVLTAQIIRTKVRKTDRKEFLYYHPARLKLQGDVNGCSMVRTDGIPASQGEVTSTWVASLGRRAVGWTLDIPADYDGHGSDESDLPGMAAVWPDLKQGPVLLPPVSTTDGPRTLSPRGVNDAGLIVGRTMVWPNWWQIETARAFVAWKGDEGYETHLLLPVDADDEGYAAVAVNNAGIIVGAFHGGGAAGFWEKSGKTTWKAAYLDALFDPKYLKAQCPGNKVLHFVEAHAINEKGRIAGRAACFDPNNKETAEFRIFRLTLQ